MTPDHLRALLQSTLEDLKVSRQERQDLAAALRDDPPNTQQWAEFRSIAFGIAREAILANARPADVLKWLYGVIKLLIPGAPPAGDACDGDVCFSPGETCRDRICGLLRATVHTVDICVYTITDNVIADDILAAHARGVRVRIISDNLKSSDLGSDIHRFEAAGVPVRLDRSRHHMHHKFAIFDGRRMVTGSYNWTVGAAFDNQEDIAILGDPALIAQYQAHFDHLWAKYR